MKIGVVTGPLLLKQDFAGLCQWLAENGFDAIDMRSVDADEKATVTSPDGSPRGTAGDGTGRTESSTSRSASASARGAFALSPLSAGVSTAARTTLAMGADRRIERPGKGKGQA